MKDSDNLPKERASLKSRLEIATNIAVLAAALLVAGYFAALFLSRLGSEEPVYRASIGTRLALPDSYDFSTHERTMILAVQDDCSYCEASMPFYLELAAKLKAACSDSGLVAILPHSATTADALLSRFGLDIPRLPNTSLASLGVTGTPTLLLVSREGTVLDVWVGQLNPEGEKKVLAAIDPVATCNEPSEATEL